MNKYQEALKQLQAYNDEDVKRAQENREEFGNADNSLYESDDCFAIPLNRLRELVDRTTPQKPINKHVLKQFGICPSCNADVNIRYHVVACGKCGQYLDWSNDEPAK